MLESYAHKNYPADNSLSQFSFSIGLLALSFTFFVYTQKRRRGCKDHAVCWSDRVRAITSPRSYEVAKTAFCERMK